MHISSNRPVSEDEKADDVCSRRHLYCDTPVVTSWAVAGQQVVFLHMYLQTRVTLEAFPVATPRGRSSISHEGEPFYIVIMRKISRDNEKTTFVMSRSQEKISCDHEKTNFIMSRSQEN